MGEYIFRGLTLYRDGSSNCEVQEGKRAGKESESADCYGCFIDALWSIWLNHRHQVSTRSLWDHQLVDGIKEA